MRKEVCIKMNRPYLKKTFGSKLFDIINIVLMLIFTFIMLYPFWYELVISFNEGLDTIKGGVYFWPRKFTLDNYKYIFENTPIGRATLISIARVVVGTTTHLVCTGLLAYITTIRWFSGWKFLRLLYLIPMFFGGGLIPYYLLMVHLHLLDTFTVYWLPGLFGSGSMLLIASYMYNLPESLAESARIDGCSELMIFFRIIAPLCLPVFAAVAIMTAVGHWNSWFDVMIFNTSGKWDTLQVYLRKILIETEQIGKFLTEAQKREALRKLTPLSIRAATTMIVTIPIVFVYPFFQRYFIGGLTIGAVKA